MKELEPKDYSDLLHRKAPTSARHPRMPQRDRAAQFAPFAALTGYEDAIDETARLTDRALTLDENQRELLDQRVRFLLAMKELAREASVTYFVPDTKKEGGSYRTVVGRIEYLDEAEKELHLSDGTVIPHDRIFAVESALFSTFE